MHLIELKDSVIKCVVLQIHSVQIVQDLKQWQMLIKKHDKLVKKRERLKVIIFVNYFYFEFSIKYGKSFCCQHGRICQSVPAYDIPKILLQANYEEQVAESSKHGNLMEPKIDLVADEEQKLQVSEIR